MIKASIGSILINCNHIIAFIAVTNERDDVFITEAGYELKLNKET